VDPDAVQEALGGVEGALRGCGLVYLGLRFSLTLVGWTPRHAAVSAVWVAAPQY